MICRASLTCLGLIGRLMTDSFSHCTLYKFLLIRCVPKDHCGGLLGVRGADDLICEDKFLKCCHESGVKTPDTVDESVKVPEEDVDYYGEQALCSDHEDEGYK